ncbi:MAG: hypothetical protein HY567_03625 [Candidatus Kerfeldbacteria bacterium]|nr:hypothetical protein [Candidatus Kerfeldbacteria bacterium]
MSNSSFGRRRRRANQRAQSIVDQINTCIRNGQLLVAHAMTSAGEAVNGTAGSAFFLAAGMSCAVGPVQASRVIRRMEAPRVYRFSPDDPAHGANVNGYGNGQSRLHASVTGRMMPRDRRIDPEDRPLRPWQQHLVASWMIDQVIRTTPATC